MFILVEDETPMFDKMAESSDLTPMTAANEVPTIEIESEPHKKAKKNHSFTQIFEGLE